MAEPGGSIETTLAISSRGGERSTADDKNRPLSAKAVGLSPALSPAAAPNTIVFCPKDEFTAVQFGSLTMLLPIERIRRRL
jgi:hypothetical protein